MSENQERDESQLPRSLMDLPVHVTTEHLIGFLDVVGLIRLSATCRTWHGVLRIARQTEISAERAVIAYRWARWAEKARDPVKWEAFKSEWMAAVEEARVRLFGPIKKKEGKGR